MPRTKSGGNGERSSARVENDVPSLTVDAQINMLVNMGLTKGPILTALMESRPDLVECIEDTPRREKVARSLHMKSIPKFNQDRYRALYEQVGKVQTRVKKERLEIPPTGEDIKIFRPGEMEYVPVHRISTGFELLDWVFGHTKEYNESGMPRGVVTLLCGEPGVGKSRLLIKVGQNVGKTCTAPKGQDRGGVLYIQTEVAASQFVGMMEGVVTKDSNFRFTTAKELDQIVTLIRAYSPDVVIIDSMQEIRQASSGPGMQRCITTLKGLAQDMGWHGLLIGQLNKQGEIAGSKKFEFLVDVCLKAKKWHVPNHFSVECERKNRFGASGRLVQFKHIPEGGVVCVDRRRVDPKSGDAVEVNDLTILGGIEAAGGTLILDQPVAKIEKPKNND